MRYAAMRLLCLFDLPMETAQEKRVYRNFRKELIANGFEMLQFSVYYRTCPNRSFAKKFYKRLEEASLPAGNVRLLSVTEKQFSEMVLVVGGKTKQEEMISNKKMVII
ncbi:CRISPR-associated endonuclease Cas2 [Streptococcus sp. H49]|uniref:CRISPR-associated endonuclease Cas2 n=1 Tax=Streptococcus huangxiaojuni TaxID=3237239 RepID=UPI0034A44C5C